MDHVVFSKNIKMNSPTDELPLINHYMSEHTAGDNSRIGMPGFGTTSSAYRAHAAFVAPLQKAGLNLEITGTAPDHLVEIVGEESIAKYKKLGGKILRPHSCKDIQDVDFTFETGANGMKLQTSPASGAEREKVTGMLDAMNVPYKSEGNTLTITDPIGIKMIVHSGGTFKNSQKFQEWMGALTREFWVQGGNESLEKKTGVQTISAIRLTEDDAGRSHRSRVSDQTPPSFPGRR